MNNSRLTELLQTDPAKGTEQDCQDAVQTLQRNYPGTSGYTVRRAMEDWLRAYRETHNGE